MRIFLWEISPRIEANQITAEIIAMLGWNCQYLTKIKAHNHMNQLSLVQIVKNYWNANRNSDDSNFMMIYHEDKKNVIMVLTIPLFRFRI